MREQVESILADFQQGIISYSVAVQMILNLIKK